MAVTCEVEAPSAMAFWKRSAEQLPLGGLAGSRDTGMMRSCCQSSVMARRTALFGHFPAQRMCQLGNGRVARFQQLVGLRRPVAKPGASRSVAGCGASRGRRAGHRRRAEPSLPPQSRAARPAGPAGSGALPRRLSPGEPATLQPGNVFWGRGWRRACRLRPQQTTAQSRRKTAAWAGRDTIRSPRSTSGRPPV
jgi:hypothetical protein